MNKLLGLLVVPLLVIVCIAAGIFEDTHSAAPPPRGAEAFRVFRSFPSHPSKETLQSIRRALDLYEPAARVTRLHRSYTASGYVWVVATERLMCIVHSRGSACAPIPRAIQGGVVLGVFDPPDGHHKEPHNFLMLGLVPDGVTTVSGLVNYHRRILLPVKGNLVSATGDEPIHVKRLVRDQ